MGVMLMYINKKTRYLTFYDEITDIHITCIRIALTCKIHQCHTKF